MANSLELPILFLSNNTWVSLEGCGGLVFFEIAEENATTSQAVPMARTQKSRKNQNSQQQGKQFQQFQQRSYAFESKLNFLSAKYLGAANRNESATLVKYGTESLLLFLFRLCSFVCLSFALFVCVYVCFFGYPFLAVISPLLLTSPGF
jgi:hypothetical protein